MTKVISRNPATGEILNEFESTRLDGLEEIYRQARQAQFHWAALSVTQRTKTLLQIRETILNHTDDLIELISKENGKPQFEVLSNEIIPTLHMLGYYAKRAPKLLKKRLIQLTLAKHRVSQIHYLPMGVTLIISSWNYPFYFPFAEVLMSLVAGNTVILKPSEVTPAIGLKIQEICNEAGLPPFVLQTVLGDGKLGEALIQQKPDKIFFTGGTATGKKIMALAAQDLIPVNLELGGKNALIVLPDANLDFATSAALNGAFNNSGQSCAATSRILVHARIAQPFTELFKEKLQNLHQGRSDQSPPSNDLGPLTFEKQKAVYETQLHEARAMDAHLQTGGEFSQDGRFLKPTLITGLKAEKLQAFQEETFGPIATLSTFQSVNEVIEKVNASPYGLAAAIITKNHTLGEELAQKLQVGTVIINESIYTPALAETPWGGVKQSGFGRKHGDTGLYEFVNSRHVHKPLWSLFVFKSPWWFPYGPFQFQAFRLSLELFRWSWIDRLKAIPHALWNFVKLLKEEKRL